LWIQGLIKLPDIFGGIVEGKFIYGVVIPGLVFGLLLFIPYLDRNPSRRWQDRKLALVLTGVVIVVLGVLTWMGSPAYRAQASPEEELALEFVPFDRHGEIHDVPWEELADGSYVATSHTEGVVDGKHLDRMLTRLRRAMEKEDLPDGVATVTITTWQRDLKRVDLDLNWQSGGQEKIFNQYTYIHRDASH
jgi:hypothetical protein